MKDEPVQNGILVVVAGVILMLILGSIHAFSVFLEPMELRFGVARGTVSITYSLALICLTTSVLFAHIVFARIRPAMAAVAICLLAGFGCLFAAYAGSIWTLWATYSLMFGTANGLGYALALQTSAQANPNHKGLAMGTITACYALGAAISPPGFDVLMARYGFAGAMLGLSITLFIAAPVVFLVLSKAKARLKITKESPSIGLATPKIFIVKLWLGYGTAVTAGLMIIGHATGLVRVFTENQTLILAAPVLIAILNMLGSLAGGLLSDRIATKHLLVTLPLLASATLFALAFTTVPWMIIAGLSLIGFTYGAIITAYPVAVSDFFGPVASVRAYGRVFTAWGTAGIIGPVLAGLLFDNFGNYQLALLVAGALSLISVVIARNLHIGDFPTTDWHDCKGQE